MKEILMKIQLETVKLKNEVSQLPRSEKSRKAQIAVTNIETAALWLESAINHNEELVQKSYS